MSRCPKCGVPSCRGSSPRGSDSSLGVDCGSQCQQPCARRQLCTPSCGSFQRKSSAASRRPPQSDSDCGLGWGHYCREDGMFSKLCCSICNTWDRFKKYVGVRDANELYEHIYGKYYNDRYHWELIKSIVFFTIGIKLIGDIAGQLMAGQDCRVIAPGGGGGGAGKISSLPVPAAPRRCGCNQGGTTCASGAGDHRGNRGFASGIRRKICPPKTIEPC